MSKRTCFLMLALFFVSLVSINCSVIGESEADISTVTIVSPSDAATTERLAAKEVRRYLYLRTGKLFPIVRSNNKLPSKGSLIIVGQKGRPAVRTLTGENPKLASSVNSLEAQQYLLKTITFRNQQAVLVMAKRSPMSVLP